MLKHDNGDVQDDITIADIEKAGISIRALRPNYILFDSPDMREWLEYWNT